MGVSIEMCVCVVFPKAAVQAWEDLPMALRAVGSSAGHVAHEEGRKQQWATVRPEAALAVVPPRPNLGVP